MSIVLQGSTSGSVTLQEPAVAGTTVLTLPAVSGTVLTDTSPKAGNVLQVVTSTSSSTTQTSSTSFVSGNLSVSITPTSATSKVYVIVSTQVDNEAATRQGNMTIYRNSTNLGNGNAGMSQFYGEAGRVQFPACITYLDSPSTTSATTYGLYFRASGSYIVSINAQPSTVSITAMEIAA
jgi:hypothetical protein